MQQLGRYKATVIALVIANAIPLIGVLFFSWSTFAIMALYWAENVIIGGVNVLKMITCAPDPDEVSLPSPGKSERAEDFGTPLASLGQSRTSLTAIHHASKLFFVPFFTIHYGMFCFVHGVFVLVLFGRDGGFLAQPSDPFDAVPQLGEQLLHGGMLLALISLGLSHLFSFVKNYLIGGEYRRITVPAADDSALRSCGRDAPGPAVRRFFHVAVGQLGRGPAHPGRGQDRDGRAFPPARAPCRRS
ncbi:MAG: DUF6498-containing protein [Pirellulales bacterium]